jgi:NADPH-dependent 2,4-dienoyl-CoA reductase/sulfur reductase-like enzyme
MTHILIIVQMVADVVMVVVGVRPATALAATAGIELGVRGAIAVDRRMRTNVPDIFAAGDCVQTYHRLLGAGTYLPLGSTAHKQGRVAGENAAGGDRLFAGSLGTQVVKVFDMAYRDAAIATRVDIYAGALHHGMRVDEVADLDLSYAPPLGSPWDAVQMAAQDWDTLKR